MDTTTPPRALALPNLLTLARIAAVPLLVVCLLAGAEPWLRFAALGLFIAASATDWLDGYLARAWQQQSRLGRMLDPIADKLLVAAALMLLVHDNTIAGIHVLAALVILSREILVSGLREFLAEVQVRVAVTGLAKIKTAVQMAALAVLIAAPAVPSALADPALVQVFGLALLWIAALLTMWTGYGYFRAGLRHALLD